MSGNYEEVKDKVLRSKNSVVCVIGERDSGKTKLAREIYSLDPDNNALIIKNIRGRMGNIFSEVCYLRGVRFNNIIIDELDMYLPQTICFDSLVKSCNKLILTGTPSTLKCNINFEFSNKYLSGNKLSMEHGNIDNMTFESLLLDASYGKLISTSPDVFHLKCS